MTAYNNTLWAGQADVAPYSFSPHDAPVEYVIEVVDRSLIRDATEKYGELRFSGLSFDRRLSDISSATIDVPPTPRPPVEGGIIPWKHSVIIRRNGRIVWMGPITSVSLNGRIEAMDTMAHYMKKLVQEDIVWDPAQIWIEGPPVGWDTATPYYRPPGHELAKLLIDARDYDTSGLRFPSFVATDEQIFAGYTQGVGYSAYEWIECVPQSAFTIAASSLTTAFDAFQQMQPLGWSLANDKFYVEPQGVYWEGYDPTQDYPHFMYLHPDEPAFPSSYYPTLDVYDFELASSDIVLDGNEQANEIYFAGGGQGADGSPYLEYYSWVEQGDTDPSTLAGGGVGRLQARGLATSNYGIYGMSSEPQDREYGRRSQPHWRVTGIQLKPGSTLSLRDLVPGRRFRWRLPSTGIVQPATEVVLAQIESVSVSVTASEGSVDEVVSFDTNSWARA